MNPPTKNTLTD